MQILKYSLIILITYLGLTGCSTKSQLPAETVAFVAPDLEVDVDEIRTILIKSDSQCQLRVKRGKNDPELISPKSCLLVKTTSGEITSVKILFAPPCKEYTLNNLISNLYFLDEKSIASKNKACRVESFKSSYGWTISQ
jgi:hypothetical protein